MATSALCAVRGYEQRRVIDRGRDSCRVRIFSVVRPGRVPRVETAVIGLPPIGAHFCWFAVSFTWMTPVGSRESIR